MVVETGIIVAGSGYAGSAILRRLSEPAAGSALLRDPDYNAPFILLDKTHDEMLLDVILSESGEVAGALVAREGVVTPIRAPAVVLATGGLQALFPGGDWQMSGDGLAIAHRAGLDLSHPVLETTLEGKARLHAAVPCKADGSTGLRGLFVAGSLGAVRRGGGGHAEGTGLGGDRPDADRVALAAATRSRQGADAFGPYHEHPTVDDPLPKGFATVKFERLQALCHQAFRQPALDAEQRERVLVELHRLKGEADEYARARTELELFSLQNACEVAILLLRAG